MQGYNKVTLFGNVSRLEEKFTKTGKVYARFSIATNSRYQDANKEWVDKPQFHSCIIWGRRAEVLIEFVKVGDPLFVEGAIEYSEYEGKWYTTINVSDLVLVPRSGGADGQPSARSEGSGGSGRQPRQSGRQAQPESQRDVDFDIDDDLPF